MYDMIADRPANRNVIKEKMTCITPASSGNNPTPIAPIPVMAARIEKILKLKAR